MRGRLTVGRDALNVLVLVRFQPPQFKKRKSSGRMRSLSRKQVRANRCGFESHGFRSETNSPVVQRQRLLAYTQATAVQVRPGLLASSRPRRAARSARHPVTVEIVGSNPIGDASIARYAN